MSSELNFLAISALTLARSTLAAVFLASALGKIRRPRQFAASVTAYELLPRTWALPFAVGLIAVESGVALLLLIGWQAQIAAATSALLLASFILAMGINLGRGRADLDCGCFGTQRRLKISARLIARNAGLILLAVPTGLWGGGFLTLDGQPLAIRQLILDVILLGSVLPVVLAGIGLIMIYRLGCQLRRLLRLTPMEEDT